jgi:hypothetical protein
MSITKELSILENLDDDFEGTIIIDGLELSVYGDAGDEYCQTKLKETAFFTESGNRYTRTGLKEISYDRWVDTHWMDWS